jgi:hypothetical protein
MLQSLGPGRTRLIQQEEFRGILIIALGGWLEAHYGPAFERMNISLKHRVEAREPVH